MRNSSIPKRRVKCFNWISVEEVNDISPLRSTQKSGKSSVFASVNRSLSLSSDNDFPALESKTIDLTPVKKNSNERLGSIVPRSSNYVNYDSKRYYCPYYIKPKFWEKINSAPRFDEKFEIEKIYNFYNFMHSEKVASNPFRSSEKTETKQCEINKQKFAVLPAVHKYKSYLKEKKLREPSFLSNI